LLAHLPDCCSAADAEQLVGQVNPAAFQKVATADDEGLEELRQHVGLLKKVCRQKAVYCLKDVRRQVCSGMGGLPRDSMGCGAIGCWV
jgi:hypothetical protein